MIHVETGQMQGGEKLLFHRASGRAGGAASPIGRGRGAACHAVWRDGIRGRTLRALRCDGGGRRPRSEETARRDRADPAAAVLSLQRHPGAVSGIRFELLPSGVGTRTEALCHRPGERVHDPAQ